jgi:hypothetical protein
MTNNIINNVNGTEILKFIKENFNLNQSITGKGKNIYLSKKIHIRKNDAISDNKKIAISEVIEMYGLGTPEDLNAFLQSKILK